MLPAEDLANQSVRLKEEQLRKEEEKVHPEIRSISQLTPFFLLSFTIPPFLSSMFMFSVLSSPPFQLREIELRVQREIHEKRQQLLAKEESLRNLESRLAAQGSDSILGTPILDTPVNFVNF